MVRRTFSLALAVSLLAGCGTTASAGLTMTTSSVQKVPAPLTAAVPGVSGPAPTVAVLPTVSVTTTVASASQVSAADVVTQDQQLEATELLAQETSSYQVKGLFDDIKNAIDRVITRWKLSSQIKAVLKNTNTEAFDLHEGEIDDQTKSRTAPITTISNTTDGGQEIVSSWNSTLRGDYRFETDRIIDADGITQVLGVTQTGTTSKDVGLSLTRTRTLTGTDGSYSVVTNETQTFKNGTKQVEQWTKLVHADGTESINGYIDTVDGWRTEITGIRDIAGKVQIQVSKIAPWQNPDNVSPLAAPAATAAAAATGAAS